MENSEEMVRVGNNFRSLINDLKRRPEDAANELGLTLEELKLIMDGKKHLSNVIISKAQGVWPINYRDLCLIKNDCPKGVKILRYDESKSTSRIMERAGKVYYEYRDTAMSRMAPFRPEWIEERCFVDDNDPNNSSVQWNNGHFMHQFTYFVGDVNFYYIASDGKKKVAVMNTGDSMYITPFVPHTFTTRKGAKKYGFILALTYGNKVAGDAQQELSAIGSGIEFKYALDFSSKAKASGELLAFNREAGSISVEELSSRTGIDEGKIKIFELGKAIPSAEEYEKISYALNVNVRDLLANDIIDEKVVVKMNSECKRWFYPSATKAYEMLELAATKNLPFSKSIEVSILTDQGVEYDLKSGLHQYGYNVGDSNVSLNWIDNNQKYSETINPGDSFYIGPFIEHNFRKKGKLVLLRVGGKVVGEPQRELSLMPREFISRVNAETKQWFNPS